MTTYELLAKAKSRLTMKHPYFGMLASRLKHEESTKTLTYASNGVRFLYNQEFITSLSEDELFFILTNCVMHHILSHQKRKLKRKGALWQIATDYAINNLLKSNGFKIPQGANYDIEFKNMYAEEIYDILKQRYNIDDFSAYDDIEEKQEKKNGKKSLFSNKKNIEMDLKEDIESSWQYAQTLAKEVAMKKSMIPKGLERLAKKVVAKDVDWKFELYNAINKHMRNNYAFMPPNKKHIHRGIALPSLSSDTLSLCIAIDTSGSINEEILGAFLEEFKTIMQNFPSISIELLIADAKVHNHYTFHNGEEFDFSLRGGGGTDYRPVFDYIEDNIPMTTMLLYFTDGEGIFPKIPPSYEVLWALSQKRGRIPFGRYILIF